LFSIGIGGSNRRQVTNGSEAIPLVAVSGNGLIAYAATSASRLVRIDMSSGAVTELIAPSPLSTGSYRVSLPLTQVAAAGSLMELHGSGLASVNHLSLCGRMLPLTPGRARFQVPWDLPDGACQLLVSADSSFEHGLSLDLRLYDVQFAQGSALVQTNPAWPGPVIVAYMTGLGPVDNNGLVSPGFRCSIDSMPVEVLYAGLAPVFTGSYQVNVRVPAPLTGNPTLRCGWDDGKGTAGTTVFLVP